MRMLVLLLLAQSSQAMKVYQHGVLDMARKSELVVVGKVLEADKDSALIGVEEVLRGELKEPRLRVPNDLAGSCFPSPNLRSGEDVALFLDHSRKVVGQGQGKVALGPLRAENLQAVRQLLRIAALDEDSANRAMLALAGSPNRMLQAAARLHIWREIGNSKLKENYRGELVRLLKHRDSQARIAALEGLRFMKAPEAVPLLIRLTRDSDRAVVEAASLTLGPYDTPDAVRALIALTRHPDPMVRIRAAIDLGNHTRRPEVKAALATLLDDKHEQVRETAPTRLIYWLREGRADELIPKLIAMLGDRSQDVQAGAVSALGHSGSPAAVEPVLSVLRRKSVAPKLEGAATAALVSLHVQGGAETRRRIEAELGLVIALVRSGSLTSSQVGLHLLASAGTPKARETLRWAARQHPIEIVRDDAKRALSR